MRKKRKQSENKLLSISSHRNGVGGAPFYVALFESPWVDWSDWPVKPKGPNKDIFQVIYFPSQDEEGEEVWNGENIAVTNVALTSQGLIGFYNNSWRGADNWGEDMRDAVREYRKASDRAIFYKQQVSKDKAKFQKQSRRRYRQMSKLQGRVQIKNRNVVITGTVRGMTRAQLKEALKDLGAVLQDTVTKETDVVIKAQKPGKSKIDKAKEYGIPIVLFQTVSHRF